MLFCETKLKVSDNSGAIYVKCLKVPGTSKPRCANIGDTVVVTTRVVKRKAKIKEINRVLKGKVYKAIIVRTKKPKFNRDGSFIQFFENSAVLIKKNQPRTFGGPKLAGSRVLGPVIFDRKLKKRYPKLYSLAPVVLL